MIIYPREIMKNIHAWIDEPQYIVILGTRRAGKTSVLQLINEYLRARNIPNTQILFITLEDPAYLHQFNKGVAEVFSNLKSLGLVVNQKVYILLDELHYLNDPSGFLKLAFDQYPTLKIIATGSSSLELKRKFKDSLAGRHLPFVLHTLNFREYLVFQKREDLKNALAKHGLLEYIQSSELPDLAEPISRDIEILCREFVKSGGYPEIAFPGKEHLRFDYLRTLIDTYVRKDVRDLFAIENITAYNNLLQVLASQIGGLVNRVELANTLRISLPTIERYLTALEQTFVIKLLNPFHSNIRSELVKMPKVYFNDTGLRNALLSKSHMTELDIRPDAGSLMENFVYSELLKMSGRGDELFFWRTRAGAETDFVWSKDGKIIPIEVKFRSFKQPAIPSGLRAFIGHYRPEIAFVITRDYTGKSVLNGCKIFFVPFFLI